MPLRRDVPGRVRARHPGPHDVLPVPQAPVRPGRPGRGAVLPGAARLRVRGAGPAVAWWPATGSRSPRTRRRRPAGPRPGCGSSPRQVIAGARKAAADEDAEQAGAAGHGPAAGRGHGGGAGSAVAGRAGAGLPGGPAEGSGRRPRPRPASRGRPTWRRWRPAPRTAGPRPRSPWPAWQLRLEQVIAAAAGRCIELAGPPAAGAGSALGRRPVSPATPPRSARPAPAGGTAGRRSRRGQIGRRSRRGGGTSKQPRRNVTDPDSRLMPVRGGGFIQGYNCQDAAADDRLMLGGYACQDTGDVLQAQRLAAGRGERRRRRRGRPRRPRRRPRPARADATTGCAPCRSKEKDDPGHDTAACHAAMTGGIGVLVHGRRLPQRGEPDRSRPGPAHRRRQDPRPGPPRARRRPPARGRHRRRGQRAPAGHPRGPRRLQAPRPRRRRTARQPQRPTAGCAASPCAACTTPPASSCSPAWRTTSGCWPPSAEPGTPGPATLRAAGPQHAANSAGTTRKHHKQARCPPGKHTHARTRPSPCQRHLRQPPPRNCNSPPDPRNCRQSRIHPPITAPTHPITTNLLRLDLSV